MSDASISDDEQSGYDVGYGKPPRTSRWPKGQSGNPGGKKKGNKSIAALFRKVARKLVPKRVGNKTKMVSLMELLVEASFVHGAKGNTKFVAWVLKVQEDFGTEAPDDQPKHKREQIYRDAQGHPKIDLLCTWNEEIAAEFKALLTEIEDELALSDIKE